MEDLRWKILLLVVFSCVSNSQFSQGSDTSKVSLLFAGDIMGHDEQIKGALDSITGQYNYEPTFRYVKPFVENADIALANLEVTLAGPIYKGYPQFSSPDALAIAAKKAGFDVFIQANNHALDRGRAGFLRTLSVLDSLDILHTGTFADSANRSLHYPLMVEKNHIRIALLNYTYGTNGLDIQKPFIINRIDTTIIRQDLEKAQRTGVDFIIVTIHWGEEYERFQNAQQKQLASYMFNHGADAIIGSHPHVVQPVEVYYGEDSLVTGLVVYSLGNFVSNQRAQYKDGGIIINLALEKTSERTRISHFSYIPTWVYREDVPGKPVFYIVPVNVYEKNGELIRLNESDRQKLSRFAEDTRVHLENVPEYRD